jgi:hypothetical protein
MIPPSPTHIAPASDTVSFFMLVLPQATMTSEKLAAIKTKKKVCRVFMIFLHS